MNLQDFRFLLSPAGEKWLAELTQAEISPQTHLVWASRLRQVVEPSQAHALLETALLRRRAAAKFSRADSMFFTREALEQASAEVVAQYRAARYADAGFTVVLDLCCGIGGDAAALAAAAHVIGVEQDALRLAMAAQNVAVYGYSAHFQPRQTDARVLSPTLLAGRERIQPQAIFFDPARRDAHGKRLYRLDEYEPPVSEVLRTWQRHVPHIGVKIGPGVDYAEIPEEAEVEFISVAGEVREGVLWFGNLRSGAARRATLLPAGHTLTTLDESESTPLSSPQTYLYEPDGAVIRAHLVTTLAQQLRASLIDPDIAYLTASHYLSTPFARAFRLEAVFPFQLKRLRHYLRQQDVGQVTIKKRGSPLDPDQLRQQLRLQGNRHLHIFLTHVMGEPTVLLGKPVANGDS